MDVSGQSEGTGGYAVNLSIIISITISGEGEGDHKNGPEIF